jgi:aspartyl-tRNA(Asn)/glutamyl-tRNA(Gln) amidotransferase subunit A
MSADPMGLDAGALACAVRSHALRPETVAEAALERIAARNPALNALVAVDADALRAEAAALTLRLKAGEAPPLAGVPLAVKDNIWVEGRRSRAGLAPVRGPCRARGRRSGGARPRRRGADRRDRRLLGIRLQGPDRSRP